MTEASFASLSPTLLARKGGAKPAMRPQLGPIPNPTSENLEDLGWNDMGDDATHDDKVVKLAPQAANESGAPNHVRQSLDRIAAHLDKPANAEPRPVVRQAASSRGKRAAFTLRLDHERHLKLRLACTVRGRSAQQLVTDALDALLDEMPAISSLAAQVQSSEK